MSEYARTAAEKARVRRLVKQGKAEIVHTMIETYMNNTNRMISYEAWLVNEVCIQKWIGFDPYTNKPVECIYMGPDNAWNYEKQ